MIEQKRKIEKEKEDQMKMQAKNAISLPRAAANNAQLNIPLINAEVVGDGSQNNER